MCTTPDEIKKLVNEILNERVVKLMEDIDATINSRMKHQEPSEKTIAMVRSLETKLDKIIEFQESSIEAISAVKDVLAGGRLIRAVAMFLKWIGGIIISVIAVKVWILK